MVTDSGVIGMHLDAHSRLMIGAPRAWRGVGQVFVVSAVLMAAFAGCGGDDASEVSTAAGDELTFTPSALPDRGLNARVIGVAGGFGWLVSDDDPTTLWRVAPDGSTVEAAGAFPDVQVRSMGSLGDGLIVSGERCNGATGSSDGGVSCASTSGIVQLIEPTGRVAWEVEVVSVEGTADDLVVALVGANDDELWVWPTNGELTAIDRSGEITNRAPSANGDPCVLGDDLYLLADESRLAEDDPAQDPSTPPTTQTPSAPADTTFVVQEVTTGGWRTVDDSRRTFTGPSLFGQCIDGGFEVSDSGVPLARWTAESQTWDDVATTAQLSDAVASGEPDFDGEVFALDPATGDVLHRGEDLTDAETGISFSFDRQPSAPPALMVASDDGLVFACAQTAPPDGAESMCAFGRTGS